MVVSKTTEKESMDTTEEVKKLEEAPVIDVMEAIVDTTEAVTEYTENQLLDMMKAAADAGKAEGITEITTPVVDVMPILDEGVQGGTYTVTYKGGKMWSASRMGRGKAVAFITGLYAGGIRVELVSHTPKES